MIKNYLIGIGGTGARVIESVLHLCAAGFGPDELGIFLIDSDQSNMNLSRTKQLLTQYKEAATQWRERSNPAKGQEAFHTRITSADDPVWTIFEKKGQTLSSFVNLQNLQQSQDPTQRSLGYLASALFTQSELDTPLDRGFRGHPSIGSVVISNAEGAGTKDAPGMVHASALDRFWQDIQDCQQGEARVFLVGSVFGGTGAAGVPTLGAPRMLKEHAKALLDTKASRIRLGGALVLPYFNFEVDKESLKREAEGMYVTPADFPIAAKAALEYYSEKDLAFDQLYFIGDSLAQKVGKFSTGGEEQNNQAHYIELVTALGALDFWREQDHRREEPDYYIAARTDSRVTWRELPVTRRGTELRSLQNELALRIGTFATFGYALNTYGMDILRREHASKENNITWYKTNFSFDPKKSQDALKDPRKKPNIETIETVATYTQSFLRWISTIGTHTGVELFDGTKVYADADATVLNPPLQHDNYIGSFLRGVGTETKAQNFADYVGFVTEVGILTASMPPGDKFLNLLYEASEAFCAETYRLTPKRTAAT